MSCQGMCCSKASPASSTRRPAAANNDWVAAPQTSTAVSGVEVLSDRFAQLIDRRVTLGFLLGVDQILVNGDLEDPATRRLQGDPVQLEGELAQERFRRTDGLR